MLSYILQVSVCLAVFYALYAAILSRETFFGINRWFLIGTLALSLILPALPSVIRTQPDPSVITYTLAPVVIGIQDASIALTPTESVPIWFMILLGIYWAGVVVLSVRFILGLRSIWRIYQERNCIEIHGSVRIVTSPRVSVPFSFFKWIFLPADHNLSETELDEIITHESAHVLAGHSIDVMLMEIACILLWPSPLVYFYRRSLRRVHEYLADAVVLRHTPLKQYGHLLLSRTAPGMQLTLANHFFHNQLKHRIMMMTKDKSRRSALLKYASLIPVLLLTIALFAFRDADRATLNTKEFDPHTTDTIPGEIFKVVDEMPRFPGCEESGLEGKVLIDCSTKQLLEFVYSRIKYPEAAKKANISGRTIAQFVVLNTGEVTRAKIIRSIGYGTDEVVLGVIGEMPRWRPGYHNGEAVNVEFNLPVVFKLQETAPQPETNEEQPPVADGVYKVVEEMPRFPGCEDSGLEGKELQQCAFAKLVAHMQDHMRYPEAAKKAGIEGRSVATFIVRTDGSIDDVKIVRSIGYGTDEVVLDIIKSMPAWRPGYQRGKAVDVEMTLPVSFVLPVENETQAGQKPQAKLDVFPVPAGDKINYTINLPFGADEIILDLVNQNGQSVHQEVRTLEPNSKSVDGTIEPRKLTPGSYVLRAICGEQVVTKSVVIQ